MIPLQQSPSLLSRALALLLPLVLVATLSVVLAVPVTVVPPAPPFPALVQGLLTRVQASVVEVLVCPAADQDPECSSPVSFSSGVLFSADGEVLTASGAVTPATRLVVATLDGQRHPAVLVGFDEALGLALLRASVVGAVHVSPATELPAVGAAVLTLGFSDLDELTPRSGTLRAAFAVSSHPALSSRELELSVAINPAGGEDGGPVLDVQEELLGLLTTVTWAPETGVVSLAVPIVGSADLIRLRSGVRREVPVLGLSASGEFWGADLPPVFFEAYGLGNLPGLVFTGVWPGGHAEQAGLKPLAPLSYDLNHQVARYSGDVIVAIDGQPVSGYQSEGFDKSWSEKQR